MKIKSKRIYWIDALKAISIFLVFYAHISADIPNQESTVAFKQVKFIYSFHMPVFFFLSGLFYKRRYQTFKKEISTLFYKRIIPAFFFSIAMIPFLMIYQYSNFGYIHYRELIKKTLHFLHGETELNYTTWFLVCLFTTEVLAIFIFSKFKKSYQKAIAATLTTSLGLILTNKYHIFEPYLGIHLNTWYLHESLVALGFYTMGHLTIKQLYELPKMNVILRGVFAVLFSALTIFTFDLNNPFPEFVVIMKVSSHGSSIYFILTAIFGILATLFIATLIPKTTFISFLGKNTLILLGLNGFLITFLNPYLATNCPNLDSAIWLTGYLTITSMASILICFPIIYILNKFIPQLVGNPFQKGPLLPSFDKL
mgnify:CR=1 FL=1